MSRFLIAVAVAATAVGPSCQTAAAGPLCDWLFGRHRTPAPTCNTCAPVTAYAPPTSCGTCQTTCTQTCQRVVVNYVPYTAYRTEWEQVPVTQYQQTTSTDPCTGCTVTCNRPCTTYSWQMKKVPYTTYRPCYRTETYSVPVTYTTPAPACNTCAPVAAAPSYAAPACSTCNVPGTVSAPANIPANTIPTISQMPPSVLSSSVVPGNYANPYGSYTTVPGYVSTEASTTQAGASSVLPATNAQPTPADQIPSLTPMIIDRRELPSDPTSFQSGAASPSLPPTAPAIRPIQDPNPSMRWENQQAAPGGLIDQTASLPTRERFEYQPVRLASYQTEIGPSAAKTSGGNELHGQVEVVSAPRAVDSLPVASSPAKTNSRWQTANW